MSLAIADERYRVIWLVRRLFRALAQKSNEITAEFRLTSADRAVMEFLYPAKALSVPDIAKLYQVARQHVQVTANGLSEKGLLEARGNPRHKRSPLMALSGRGRQTFKAILAKDAEAIDLLFGGFSDSKLKTTRQTLQALLDALSDQP